MFPSPPLHGASTAYLVEDGAAQLQLTIQECDRLKLIFMLIVFSIKKIVYNCIECKCVYMYRVYVGVRM